MSNQTYFERIRDYAKGFHSENMEKQCIKAITDLRKRKKPSYKWIYKALIVKEREVWEKHGFGLLFNDRYEAQVNKILAHEEKEAAALSWDWIEADAAQEESLSN